MPDRASPPGPSSWRDLTEPWFCLVRKESVAVAPVFAFQTPAEAWGYGAVSAVCTPAPAAALLVRVTVAVRSGRVGVSLTAADCSALTSLERELAPEDGVTTVYFPWFTQSGPARVLLRNSGPQAQAASGLVQAVSVADPPALSAAEAAEVSRDGWGVAALQALGVAKPRAAAEGALYPVSLGGACQTRYQLSRHCYGRQYAVLEGRSSAEIFDKAAAYRLLDRHLFDWQITPVEAVAAYLEADFEGVFEQEDLFVGETGEVSHRLLHTRHPHDFHAVDGRLDDHAIKVHYAQARAKFDYLAAKFRTLLNTSGRFLYVLHRQSLPLPEQARRLLDLLGSRSRDHRATLLVAHEGQPSASGAWGVGLDDIQTVVIAPGSDKAPADVWQGDDDAWEAVLSHYRLRWGD